MKQLLKQLHQKLIDIRQREAAQREFMRAIYRDQNLIDFDYEKPAYLRRARSACSS